MIAFFVFAFVSIDGMGLFDGVFAIGLQPPALAYDVSALLSALVVVITGLSVIERIQHHHRRERLFRRQNWNGAIALRGKGRISTRA